MNLAVQISWQAHNLVNLEVQISWQVQHLVNLEVQISWQAQHFVNLKVQISSWQAHHLANLKSADFVAGTALGATFFDEVLQKCFAQVFNMHVGIQSRRKCVLPCYGLSSAIGLVCSSSRQLSSSRQPLVARTHTHTEQFIYAPMKSKRRSHCMHSATACTLPERVRPCGLMTPSLRARKKGSPQCAGHEGTLYRSNCSYRKLPPPACPGTACIDLAGVDLRCVIWRNDSPGVHHAKLLQAFPIDRPSLGDF